MMHELISESFFNQIAALLILASVLGFASLLLRQPLIIAFIAVGILCGPAGLNVIDSHNHLLDTLAELGVTILLFTVGLKLDISLLKKMGTKALIAGLGQVSLTALLGFGLCQMLGFNATESLIMSAGLAFSSTIIVVKLLSDKRAIDSLYGRMALGILIVQDIAVIGTMLAVTSITQDGGQDISVIASIADITIKLTVLVILTALFIKYIANGLVTILNRAPELTIIFAAGLAAMMSALCHHMGLSQELGGLMAGVALASTPYHHMIATRLSPLRDFMLLFFFVILGVQMNPAEMGDQVIPALIISAFVLFGKPLIIMLVMSLQGYKKRTCFMTGTSLAQTSEFSFILIAMTAAAGLTSGNVTEIMTMVGLITMGISSYVIIYNTSFHAFFETHGLLKSQKEEDQSSFAEHDEDDTNRKKFDIIVYGLGRYGMAMATRFKEKGYHVLGVDFDPQVMKKAKENEIDVIYGDAADPEGPIHLPLRGTKLVIFAFHHYMTGPLHADLRRALAKSLRVHGYKGMIAATTHNLKHDHDLNESGIDLVLVPFIDAAHEGVDQAIRKLGAATKTTKSKTKKN